MYMCVYLASFGSLDSDQDTESVQYRTVVYAEKQT